MDHIEIQRRLGELRKLAQAQGHVPQPIHINISEAGMFPSIGEFDLFIHGPTFQSILVRGHFPAEVFAKAEEKIRTLPRRWSDADVAATLGIEVRAA
jgi:hypothetical protein